MINFSGSSKKRKLFSLTVAILFAFNSISQAVPIGQNTLRAPSTGQKHSAAKFQQLHRQALTALDAVLPKKPSVSKGPSAVQSRVAEDIGRALAKPETSKTPKKSHYKRVLSILLKLKPGKRLQEGDVTYRLTKDGRVIIQLKTFGTDYVRVYSLDEKSKLAKTDQYGQPIMFTAPLTNVEEAVRDFLKSRAGQQTKSGPKLSSAGKKHLSIEFKKKFDLPEEGQYVDIAFDKYTGKLYLATYTSVVMLDVNTGEHKVLKAPPGFIAVGKDSLYIATRGKLIACNKEDGTIIEWPDGEAELQSCQGIDLYEDDYILAYEHILRHDHPRYPVYGNVINVFDAKTGRLINRISELDKFGQLSDFKVHKGKLYFITTSGSVGMGEIGCYNIKKQDDRSLTLINYRRIAWKLKHPFPAGLALSGDRLYFSELDLHAYDLKKGKRLAKELDIKLGRGLVGFLSDHTFVVSRNTLFEICNREGVVRKCRIKFASVKPSSAGRVIAGVVTVSDDVDKIRDANTQVQLLLEHVKLWHSRPEHESITAKSVRRSSEEFGIAGKCLASALYVAENAVLILLRPPRYAVKDSKDIPIIGVVIYRDGSEIRYRPVEEIDDGIRLEEILAAANLPDNEKTYWDIFIRQTPVNFKSYSYRILAVDGLAFKVSSEKLERMKEADPALTKDISVLIEAIQGPKPLAKRLAEIEKNREGNKTAAADIRLLYLLRSLLKIAVFEEVYIALAKDKITNRELPLLIRKEGDSYKTAVILDMLPTDVMRIINKLGEGGPKKVKEFVDKRPTKPTQPLATRLIPWSSFYFQLRNLSVVPPEIGVASLSSRFSYNLPIPRKFKIGEIPATLGDIISFPRQGECYKSINFNERNLIEDYWLRLEDMFTPEAIKELGQIHRKLRSYRYREEIRNLNIDLMKRIAKNRPEYKFITPSIAIFNIFFKRKDGSDYYIQGEIVLAVSKENRLVPVLLGVEGYTLPESIKAEPDITGPTLMAHFSEEAIDGILQALPKDSIEHAVYRAYATQQGATSKSSSAGSRVVKIGGFDIEIDEGLLEEMAERDISGKTKELLPKLKGIKERARSVSRIDKLIVDIIDDPTTNVSEYLLIPKTYDAYLLFAEVKLEKDTPPEMMVILIRRSMSSLDIESPAVVVNIPQKQIYRMIKLLPAYAGGGQRKLRRFAEQQSEQFKSSSAGKIVQVGGFDIEVVKIEAPVLIENGLHYAKAHSLTQRLDGLGIQMSKEKRYKVLSKKFIEPAFRDVSVSVYARMPGPDHAYLVLVEADKPGLMDIPILIRIKGRHTLESSIAKPTPRQLVEIDRASSISIDEHKALERLANQLRQRGQKSSSAGVKIDDFAKLDIIENLYSTDIPPDVADALHLLRNQIIVDGGKLDNYLWGEYMIRSKEVKEKIKSSISLIGPFSYTHGIQVALMAIEYTDGTHSLLAISGEKRPVFYDVSVENMTNLEAIISQPIDSHILRPEATRAWRSYLEAQAKHIPDVRIETELAPPLVYEASKLYLEMMKMTQRELYQQLIGLARDINRTPTAGKKRFQQRIRTEYKDLDERTFKPKGLIARVSPRDFISTVKAKYTDQIFLISCWSAISTPSQIGKKPQALSEIDRICVAKTATKSSSGGTTEVIAGVVIVVSTDSGHCKNVLLTENSFMRRIKAWFNEYPARRVTAKTLRWRAKKDDMDNSFVSAIDLGRNRVLALVRVKDGLMDERYHREDDLTIGVVIDRDGLKKARCRAVLFINDRKSLIKILSGAELPESDVEAWDRFIVVTFVMPRPSSAGGARDSGTIFIDREQLVDEPLATPMKAPIRRPLRVIYHNIRSLRRISRSA